MWKPSDNIFSYQEDAMTGSMGEFISSDTNTRGRMIINYLSTGEELVVDFTDEEIFFNALKSKVNVARVGASKGRHGVTSESLSQKWLISLQAARSTVQHTTQQGIRTILHLYLSRLFKKKYRELSYNRLQHNVLTDTI